VSDEWLATIEATLRDSLGSDVQKRRAWIAARDMQANLPSGSPRADRWAADLRRLFEAWVHHMIYLRRVESLDEHLPQTVQRTEAEVATYYGLRTSKGIDDKLRYLESAAETRIQRAVTHLEVGWPEDMCICFVASREEWRQALARAKRAAA